MRRLIVIVLSLILAIGAGRDSALAFWRADDSGFLPKIWADDPLLQLRANERLLPEPQKLRRHAQIIGATAREVLRATPLNVMAMRQLGTISSLRSPGAGHAQIVVAERISRRDIAVELLMIEATASKGDVAAALSHFDRALSVVPATRQQLFPLLAAELGEPDFPKSLAAYASRPWLEDFAVNAIDYDAPPEPLMTLYSELAEKVPVQELRAGTLRVIGWLRANQQIAAIAAFADRLPGVQPHALDTLGFTALTTATDLAPLSWEFHNDADAEVASDGNNLTIRISPEKTSVAAARLTFLKPGAFEVRQTVSYEPGSPHAQLEWQVVCLGGTQLPVWHEALPDSAAGLKHVAEFEVPPGCDAQNWQLRTSAKVSQIPAMARISDLTVVQRK